MTYTYHLSYDKIKDLFYAYVDIDKETMPVFIIENTEEMKSYITTKVMKNIDDVEGLEKHLKRQGILSIQDDLVLSEKLIP